MNKQWQKSLFRIAFWISVEIVLSLLNLDTLIDVSEFLFEKHVFLTSPKLVLQQEIIANRTLLNSFEHDLSALTFTFPSI